MEANAQTIPHRRQKQVKPLSPEEAADWLLDNATHNYRAALNEIWQLAFKAWSEKHDSLFADHHAG